MCVEEKMSWIDPIKTYLETGALPGDKVEADKIRKQSISFYVENGMMYKRDFSMSLLMCLREKRGKLCVKGTA